MDRENTINPQVLIAEARSILDRADSQRRDLSDFESGRVDALLDIAGRCSRHVAVQNSGRTVNQCQ